MTPLVNNWQQNVCCEANEYGFKCQCIKRRNHSEDDGYADWLYDQERDRQMMAQVEKE